MSKQLLDCYASNRVDFDIEKATGTHGVIIKAGQGEYGEYFVKKCNFIDECKRVGLPYGIYWVIDARYSPESHKAALKQYFPDGDFGQLGLWLDVEKPLTSMPESRYRKLPYAFYKPIESIARSMLQLSKTRVGIYTSPYEWALCGGIIPKDKQDWFATLPLWTAQYGVPEPKLYGSWTQWKMWQYQENPDYSVCSDEVFAELTGIAEKTTVLEPPVATQTGSLSSTTIVITGTDYKIESRPI
jgi:GH25 family lysozyme M1 (1,4-beta-N-acetylmuramidase)